MYLMCSLNSEKSISSRQLILIYIWKVYNLTFLKVENCKSKIAAYVIIYLIVNIHFYDVF